MTLGVLFSVLMASARAVFANDAVMRIPSGTGIENGYSHYVKGIRDVITKHYDGTDNCGYEQYAEHDVFHEYSTCLFAQEAADNASEERPFGALDSRFSE